mgnify:CR=1 FL=1
MSANFFPQRPDAHPAIYAYEDLNPRYKGLLKVGYTEIGAEKRVAQQYPTKRPDGLKPYRIVLSESAMRPDGTCFTDREVHAILKKRFRDPISQDTTEFFRCTADDVAAAILAVRTGTQNLENRTQSFGLRPEQREAIDKAMEYYASAKEDRPDRTPKFLWNAKMRFGKTFAAYKLAQKLGCTKVLMLTFKPAVEAAWEEDLMTHIDFEGWQFICRDGLTYEQADKTRPFVCFGSFQDYLGTNENGGIKAKNEWVHTTNWDLVIFDEYHFGAWRENAKKLFEIEDEDENYDFDAEKYKLDEADNAYNETFLPITTSRYLFLSGTPFRALNSGEFIEEQIYNWTYSDEQRAKEAWGNTPDNPYRALPRMVLLTYKIPEEIRRVAEQGEFNEFDLNVFFSAKVQQKGKPETARFVYENEVQKWLDLIRGAHLPASMDDLRLGHDKRPPMPYSDGRLLNVLSHTLWFMPNVASCFAMANLLKQRQNTFYHDYKINVCAGTKAGIGVDALAPVQASMGDPLETKTITLSCGKLTTGVTVRPWTGIFMLRNLKSPETYFQAAFRVQSPWEITTGAGTKEIMKHECYVFDFALDRALKQISSYSIQLHPHEANPEKSVAEFINFLPVLAYDGSSMKQVDAQDILDIAMAGTSATLLAKRWQSALLVNVDNETLVRLMANEEAMAALMKIEGFRSLNADIETIINKSESVKKAKEKGEKLTPKEKKELSDEEKEFKSKRKEIQEKLIKFATRIPIFMYLTDFRERSLKDVITQLEPGLFKKVTGLDVKDFELLVSLNVFNSAVMNPAVYNFKRYEDASLSYTGVDRHEGEDVGGWDTVIKRKEYETLFYNQQATMKAAAPAADDLPDKPYIFEPDEDELEPEPIKPKKKGKKQADVITYTLPVEKPAAHVAESKVSTNKTPVTPIMATKPSAPDSRTQKPSLDTSGYSTGVKINHKKFGNGVIVDMKESDNGPLITVRFNAGGIKTLSLTIVLENHVIEKL